MPLGKKQIDHLGHLARLQLTPQETDRFDRELGVILDYFEQLKQVETHGVQTLKSITAATRMRGDESAPSLTTDNALAGAPKEDGEYFLVPRVIDR